MWRGGGEVGKHIHTYKVDMFYANSVQNMTLKIMLCTVATPDVNTDLWTSWTLAWCNNLGNRMQFYKKLLTNHTCEKIDLLETLLGVKVSWLWSVTTFAGFHHLDGGLTDWVTHIHHLDGGLQDSFTGVLNHSKGLSRESWGRWGSVRREVYRVAREEGRR